MFLSNWCQEKEGKTKISKKVSKKASTFDAESIVFFPGK
jgi:hypothetical protein